MTTRFLYGLAGLVFVACGVHSDSLDKTGTLWWPCLEWSIDNADYSGNPFDVVATATFTHSASGEERTTGMFYDGGTSWKFRFTGTRTYATWPEESAVLSAPGATGAPILSKTGRCSRRSSPSGKGGLRPR